MRSGRRALSLAGVLAAALTISACSSAGKAHRPPYTTVVTHVAPRRPVSTPTLASELLAVRRLARYGLPLFCGGRRRRMVALTFDDGPGPYTRLAIRKLRQFHARATFFLVGKQIRAYPGLARLEKTIATFGDHTMTHPFLPALAHGAMAHEIIAARALIARATGEQVDLFRPPYEGRTPAVDREVRSLGMLQVLWNVDSTDSVGGDYATIERVVLGGLDPGSIVLMHENHGQTIRALPTILKAVAHRHLQPVTIPELITLDPPSPEQLRSGLGGCPVSRAGGNGG